jgi:muramoyltetrapeptide carboxypeptidase
MIKPPPLALGNTIGLVAPGRKLDAAIIYQAKELIEARGFKVEFGSYLFSTAHSYLSAQDSKRLADLQQMLDNPTISAILCARGGYGTTRILDQLDFSLFQKNPKWICGFSDITALHLKLNSLGIQSIHGTMPVLFNKEDSKTSINSLFSLLTGKDEIIEARGSDFNSVGECTGELIGGNLSLLVDSLGTATEINTTNKILVIEEIDEPAYKVDRMMIQLKRAGKLDKLAGLVVGHMTDIKEGELPFGESVYQILLNPVNENCPVAFNFPIGHENPNLAWVEGKVSTLIVTKNKSSLVQI